MPQKDLSLSLPSLHIYFQSQRAGIDGQATDRLVEFISAARKTLDCAIYDLKDPDILNALKNASNKVDLRIAYDAGKEKLTGGAMADPKPAGTEQELEGAGLLKFATPVHVSGAHLMHSKYVVRDGASVWTGSGNWTHGGLELQDNIFLAIDSIPLATAYAENFQTLLLPSRKHDSPSSMGVEAAASRHLLRIGAVQIVPYFSGTGTEVIEDAIVALIRQASKIRIMAMLISDPGILDALTIFRSASKNIAGVLDPHEMAQVMKLAHGKAKDSALFWFADGDRRFVAAPSHAYSDGDANDFMHNKTMIIDDETVITGSYNFSENAENNDENILILQSAAVAQAYNRYFEALQAEYRKHGAKLPPTGTTKARTRTKELVAA